MSIGGTRWRHGVAKSLPEDIVAEILSKLPVKSVCRFRSVSKSFLSLINAPHFVKLHLNRSHTLRLLVLSCFLPTSVHSIDLETSLSTHIPFPLLHDSFKSELVGSCNGLFCFRVIPNHRDVGKYIIFNPSTREFKTIPDFKFPRKFELYGFGYAESIDDYKLVKMICNANMVYIFSMRNNTWKIVHDDSPYPYSLLEYDEWGNPSFPICSNLGGIPCGGISHNGAIHWSFKLKHEDKFIVCAFCLVQEKFKILPTPHTLLVSHYHRNISVGVLGGCLTLMCMLKNSTAYIFEFWVMKEYGEEESWTRISTIRSNPTNSIRFSSPLCFWNDNNRHMIVFDNVFKLVLYDAKDGAYKDIFVVAAEKFQIRWIRDAQLYVESLVSPNCYTSHLPVA